MDALIDSFHHLGPGGDRAMPLPVREQLEGIPRGACRTIAGVRVVRQTDGNWNVAGDPNLATPWSAMQSIQMVRGSYRPYR